MPSRRTRTARRSRPTASSREPRARSSSAGANWTFDLTGGLTYDHLLFYVSKIGGDESCALGIGNVGGGTLFCPRLKIHVNGDTQWQGAAYGGASGANGEVRIGDGVTFTYAPFTADVTP